MIEIEGPDGSINEFPDGTPDVVIERAMAAEYSVELPSEPNPIPMHEGIIRSAFQGTTFGGGDELAAGLAGAVGGDYDTQLERSRSRHEQFQEEHPVIAGVAEVAGALPTAFLPLGPLGKAAEGGKMLTRAVAGGAIGAGQGTTYGFLDGEDGFENRIDDARTGAIIGGGVGAAAPLAGTAVGLVGRRLRAGQANRATVAAAPTAQELRSQATKAFDAAAEDGLSVKPEVFKGAVDDIARWAADQGIDPTLHPGATAALKRLVQAADDPDHAIPVETLRRVLGSAAGSRVPDEGRIANGMIDRLDGFMDELTPDQVVSGSPDSVALLKRGRELWGRMRRTELVDDAVVRAERRAASSGSGGNVNNAVRQNLKSILDNPSKRRGFSEAELQAMEDVVRGTPTQNAMRLLGKLSPESGALPLTANLLGGAATLGASAPLTVASAAAKRLADRGTAANTRLARALVANGVRQPHLPVNPQYGRMAELIAQRNAAITGGN